MLDDVSLKALICIKYNAAEILAQTEFCTIYNNTAKPLFPSLKHHCNSLETNAATELRKTDNNVVSVPDDDTCKIG